MLTSHTANVKKSDPTKIYIIIIINIPTHNLLTM